MEHRKHDQHEKWIVGGCTPLSKQAAVTAADLDTPYKRARPQFLDDAEYFRYLAAYFLVPGCMQPGTKISNTPYKRACLQFLDDAEYYKY
jgi:hypothetical protein